MRCTTAVVAKITRFEGSTMIQYEGHLEPRGSKLTPFKSTFYAKNFIRRLS